MFLLVRMLLRFFRGLFSNKAELVGNSPEPRDVGGPEKGKIVAIPYLGGLHHRYARAA